MRASLYLLIGVVVQTLAGCSQLATQEAAKQARNQFAKNAANKAQGQSGATPEGQITCRASVDGRWHRHRPPNCVGPLPAHAGGTRCPGRKCTAVPCNAGQIIMARVRHNPRRGNCRRSANEEDTCSDRIKCSIKTLDRRTTRWRGSEQAIHRKRPQAGARSGERHNIEAAVHVEESTDRCVVLSAECSRKPPDCLMRVRGLPERAGRTRIRLGVTTHTVAAEVPPTSYVQLAAGNNAYLELRQSALVWSCGSATCVNISFTMVV